MYRNVIAAAANLASGSCCRVRWSKKKKMYECMSCGYTSERKSNVGRHYRRIHCELRKHKTCVACEKKFATKGEFYEHCEKKHPHLRNSSFITSEKYKIGKKQKCALRRRRAPDVFEELEDQDASGESEDQEASEEMKDLEVSEEIEDQKVPEKIEDQKVPEQIEDWQGDIENSGNEENIEPTDEQQKGDEQLQEDERKVIVQELPSVYASVPYPALDNDEPHPWSHRPNDFVTSSPVRSLRTDIVSPVLWTHSSFKLPTNLGSSSESNELSSSPVQTIRTDNSSFSPARSAKTNNSRYSPARSFKNDDTASSYASSVTSEDDLSSPAKAYKTNQFVPLTTMSPHVFPSTSACLPKAGPSSTTAYCNTIPSCSHTSMQVNAFLSRKRLPLKKRLGNFIKRQPLADTTNMQNNEFNVKSCFNNNQVKVENRNFSALNEQIHSFLTNIDFDDLDAILILTSLKGSNR